MADEIFSIGLQGLQNARARAVDAADRINRAFSPEAGDTDDAVSGILDLQSSVRESQASVKVLQTGDKMLGAILDILG